MANARIDTPPLALRRALATMAEQHGLASDAQVRACGVSLRQQKRLIGEGLWMRYAPAVIADGATADTWHRRAMAATLAPGTRAVLTGAAAARLHGLDGFADIERIIVVVPVGRRLRVDPEVTLWRSRLLADGDVTTVDGIRVTTVAVTLIFLARYRHELTTQALDSALRLGCTAGDLRTVFERWKGIGVEGPAALLRSLHERTEQRLPRSWFQRLARNLLVGHGITLVDEWPVQGLRGERLADLDLADVELKVGVECQSWAWHGTPAAQRRDAARKRKLRRLGWDIVELWWSDLDRLDEVLTDILIALDRARRLQSVLSRA